MSLLIIYQVVTPPTANRPRPGMLRRYLRISDQDPLEAACRTAIEKITKENGMIYSVMATGQVLARIRNDFTSLPMAGSACVVWQAPFAQFILDNLVGHPVQAEES